MARQRVDKDPKKRRKPATTLEARENELISLAADLAEEQLASGSASSQVISHFLKLGSTREQLEQERLRHENELLQVKKAAIESQKRVEELYMTALDAMRAYAGNTIRDFDDEE